METDARGGERRGGDEPLYAISVAAELAGAHPQTLRAYEREGLVNPRRSVGNVRRYSDRDVERVLEIQRLTQGEGLNLAGVRIVLELRDAIRTHRRRVAQLERQLEEVRARLRSEVEAAHRSHRFEIVPVRPGTVELYRSRDH